MGELLVFKALYKQKYLKTPATIHHGQFQRLFTMKTLLSLRKEKKKKEKKGKSDEETGENNFVYTRRTNLTC